MKVDELKKLAKGLKLSVREVREIHDVIVNDDPDLEDSVVSNRIITLAKNHPNDMVSIMRELKESMPISEEFKTKIGVNEESTKKLNDMLSTKPSLGDNPRLALGFSKHEWKVKRELHLRIDEWIKIHLPEYVSQLLLDGIKWGSLEAENLLLDYDKAYRSWVRSNIMRKYPRSQQSSVREEVLTIFINKTREILKDNKL